MSYQALAADRSSRATEENKGAGVGFGTEDAAKDMHQNTKEESSGQARAAHVSEHRSGLCLDVRSKRQQNEKKKEDEAA